MLISGQFSLHVDCDVLAWSDGW